MVTTKKITKKYTEKEIKSDHNDPLEQIKNKRNKYWTNGGTKILTCKTNSTMAERNSSLLVITLNVNRLNSPIKTERLAE